MKILIQILLSFTIIGCSSTKKLSIESLEGDYKWIGSYDVGEKIEFRSDSTFIFYWTQGLMNGVTKGRIENINSKFRLYSDLDRNTFKFELEIPPQIEQDYYEIMVEDDWSILIGATCIAYSNGQIVQRQSTNEMGKCRFEPLRIDSIVIKYLGYQDAQLSVERNETPKSLIIKLKADNHYHYFEGQSIRIINKRTIELETFERKKIFKR